MLDVQSGKHLRTLPDLAEPQGAYYEPSTNRLFVACAQDGAVKIYDASSLQLLQTVKLGGDADNIRSDTRGGRVIVGYGDGALGFLDSNGKRSGEIALDAHPESFQLEKTGTRVFVNVPDRKEIRVAAEDSFVPTAPNLEALTLPSVAGLRSAAEDLLRW